MDRIMKTLNKMIRKGITTRQLAEYLYLKGFQLRRIRSRYLLYYSEEFKEMIIVESGYTRIDNIPIIKVVSVERRDVYDE